MPVNTTGQAIVTSVIACFPGDIVASRHTGTVYRVEKVKQVKAICMDVDGQLWDVRFEGMREATADETRAFKERQPDPGEQEIVRIGHIVRFKVPSSAKYAGHYIVIKTNGNSVSLVKAGGDLTSQYFPSVLKSQLEVAKEPVTVQNV